MLAKRLGSNEKSQRAINEPWSLIDAKAPGARERVMRGISSSSNHRDAIEALGQLAAGFAHDLGNFMAATKLSLDMIEQSNLDPETKLKVDSAIAAVTD